MPGDEIGVGVGQKDGFQLQPVLLEITRIMIGFPAGIDQQRLSGIAENVGIVRQNGQTELRRSGVVLPVFPDEFITCCAHGCLP
ncbi:hypothetical protein SDC9_150625 [bioreactor metagenome]|uniref:Uncharacterized protein n=1 Tax=bioreactor metagenome TaxID=1076179 RepID=A0A645EN02_9ZZZZ